MQGHDAIPAMRAAQAQNAIGFGIGAGQPRRFQVGAVSKKRSPSNESATSALSPTMQAKATFNQSSFATSGEGRFLQKLQRGSRDGVRQPGTGRGSLRDEGRESR